MVNDKFKVALIFPRFRYPAGDPPLGVAYLAARMRQQAGVTPLVIDTTFVKNPVAMVERVLSEQRFDLVGISAMVTMVRDALALGRLVKKRQPQATVVMGGPQATVLPELMLRDPAVDAVAVGEGEDTLAEVVRLGRLERVPGLWLKQGDSWEPSPAREPIADLDALPFPALELLPMEDYFANWFQLDTVRPGLRGAPVLATRGCPYDCAFCQPTLHRLFGRGLRKRSPGNLVDEIALLKERFRINAFLFTDDTFCLDRDWGIKVCEELQDRKLDLVWGCNLRADMVDRELLHCMYGAGLRKIYMGVECFSDDIRHTILNKSTNRRQITAAVAAAGAEGVRVQGYFMLGTPTETRSDIFRTIRFARRLQIEDATFNITSPLPGTHLLERYRERVVVGLDELDYYKRYAFRPQDGLNQRFFGWVQVWAYVSFYLRPLRMWHMLKLVLGLNGPKRLWLKIRRVLG